MEFHGVAAGGVVGCRIKNVSTTTLFVTREASRTVLKRSENFTIGV